MLRSFAGGDLFGEVWGSTPANVVALHGWRRTHEDFKGVVGPGSRSGPLASIAVDLPGFGSSPAPAEVWGSEDYARSIARMLDEGGPELADGPVVVLGHSFGGRVAVHLAAARPDLVRAIVLTGAPVARSGGQRRKPPLAYRLVRSARKARLVPESVLESARKRHGSPDYLAAQGIIRDVLVRTLAEDYAPQLAALDCPVELVWGDDDTEASLTVAQAIVRAVPGAVLEVCPGAGHLTPLTVPDRLRAAVDRALAAPVGSGAEAS
jgi:pimeloyl-ACP methyl ester carboxylesterase